MGFRDSRARKRVTGSPVAGVCPACRAVSGRSVLCGRTHGAFKSPPVQASELGFELRPLLSALSTPILAAGQYPQEGGSVNQAPCRSLSFYICVRGIVDFKNEVPGRRKWTVNCKRPLLGRHLHLNGCHL